ncbi:MAG: cytochrome C, partial [Candidatus Nephrothrix sp. EaCA]
MIKNTHKNIANNLLAGLNIFILFLLAAESYVTIPQWLQPIGRMHALVLHFPIVILILAMWMEFFRFRTEFAKEKFYAEFTSALLLVGALLSAVTVIMGLFLSHEPGYEGGTLQLHKWFGVSITFISSFICLFRNSVRYGAKTAMAGAVAVVCGLMVTGHYGAVITHGENFILEPVTSKKAVTFDKALVYRDVVQPVLESKCVSCHNADKVKGGLMLTNEASLLKGGKTGKLFVPGQPQVSLLLKRIHLPAEDNKHMPPTGKTQLTPAEISLLRLWVKDKATFTRKVSELPENDSLKMIAAGFLKPAETVEEQYEFAAADDKVIKKLNNNYRSIYPLSEGSPALAVNIYNKETYAPDVLTDLSPIKKQITALDLHKMPVKDAELKTIAQFENLRTLNLNFTDITGSALKDLSPLKHLRSLSVAGTALNLQSLEPLNTFAGLNKLTIWNTNLTPADIQHLKSKYKKVQFIGGFKGEWTPARITPPQVKNPQFVFTKPIPLLLHHPIKGTDIRYTTDGTDPDSIKSAAYKPGIIISENTTVKAKAFKAGWLSSDIVRYAFCKNTYKPDSIRLLTIPHDRHQADLEKTLIDGELGIVIKYEYAKWLGYKTDLQALMYFNKPVKPNTLTLNCLKLTGNNVFLPSEIQVWGGDDDAHLKLIGTLKTAEPKKNDSTAIAGLVCKLTPGRPVSCIKLAAKPAKIP